MADSEIRDIFTQAVALNPTERERFVAELKLTRPELAEQLQRLIEKDKDPLEDLDRSIEIPTELPSTSENQGFPRQFGKHRLLRRVGAGGGGIVFEAEQDVPRRRVAIKILHPWNRDKAVSDRFRHEVHALGRMDHPNIAKLLEFSTADLGFGSQQYLAMEYVEGVSPLKHATDLNLSRNERIKLMISLVEAVHSMHLKGIVHRDLKPSNVLVTPAGIPKIVDFGIASLRDAGFATLTHTGEILGTLRYMSPEQVQGSATDVDLRTDIYSLGVIAYELLSGQMPYESDELPQSVTAIQQETPPLLGSIDRRLRDDIEHVVARALEKKPDERYQSASAFADDLERSLRGQAFAARYGSIATRIARVWKHQKRRIISTVIALTIILAASIGVPASLYQKQLAANRARHATRLSESFAEAFGMLRRVAQKAPLELILEDGGYDHLLIELEPFPNAWAQTASTIGSFLANNKDFVTAEALLTTALETALNAKPPSETVILDCTVRLCVFYENTQPDKALDLAKTGYARASDEFGPDSPRAQDFAIRAADIYFNLGDLTQANIYATLALNSNPQLTNPRQQSNASDRLLGPILMKLGRLDEAEQIIQESIAWYESVDFTRSRIYAWQVLSLAGVRYQRGDLQGAERLFKSASEIVAGSDGVLNIQYISAIQSIGVCLRDQGRLMEAEQYILRSLEIRRTMYGDDHRHVASSMVTLANLYQLMPETTPDRIETARRGLAMRLELDVIESEIAEAELALGSLLMMHGDFDAAEELLSSANDRYAAVPCAPWLRQYASALLMINQIQSSPYLSPQREDVELVFASLISQRGENDPWVRVIDRWRTKLDKRLADRTATSD